MMICNRFILYVYIYMKYIHLQNVKNCSETDLAFSGSIRESLAEVYIMTIVKRK